MRRDREYSRGLLLWQHNDCWPVVSWSGIDYLGRWKGQQYYAKRFFAPVLATAHLEQARAELVVVNDRPGAVSGQLQWTLYRERDILCSAETDVTLPPASAQAYAGIDLPEKGLWNRCVLCYTFRQEDHILSRGTLLLAEQREYSFEQPTIQLRMGKAGDGYWLEMTSDCYVKGLCVDLAEGDALFSDNFFDLEPNVPYMITVHKSGLPDTDEMEAWKRELTLICVNNVACGKEMTGPVILWKEFNNEAQ